MKGSQGWGGAGGPRCWGCQDPPGDSGMGVPRLEIWGPTVEHRDPRQHVLVTAMDLPLEREGGAAPAGRRQQEFGLAAWKGCGYGARGRGEEASPGNGGGSLWGLLRKAPASVAESWEL